MQLHEVRDEEPDAVGRRARVYPGIRVLGVSGIQTGCLKAVWLGFLACVFEVWPAPGAREVCLNVCVLRLPINELTLCVLPPSFHILVQDQLG